MVQIAAQPLSALASLVVATTNFRAIEQRKREIAEAKRAARKAGRFSTLGLVAGAGVGAALAAPTGGVSIPVGAALGGSLGAAVGRQIGGGPAVTPGEALAFGTTLASAQAAGDRQDSLNTLALSVAPPPQPARQSALGSPPVQPVPVAPLGPGQPPIIPQAPPQSALSPLPAQAAPQQAPINFRGLAANLIRRGDVGAGISALGLAQKRTQTAAETAQLSGIQRRVDAATTGDFPTRLSALRQGRSEALNLGTSAGRQLAKQHQTEIDALQDRAVTISSDPFSRTAIRLGKSFPLSSDDITEVEADMRARQTTQTTEQTTARVSAEIEARLDAPIPDALAQKLGVPLGTTAREAQGKILEDPADLKPDQRKTIAETAAVRGATENLLELYDPEFVGPVAGRRLAVAATIGFDPFNGQPITPRKAEFVAAGNQLKNRVVRALTGAQVGQGGETRRIMGEIPQITDPSTVWEAKAKLTLENIDRLEAIASQKTIKGAQAAAGGQPNETDAQRRARLKKEFGLR